MSEMSDYLEDELVKHIFRTGSFTKPPELSLALLTTSAVDGDTGQFTTGTGVEVSGGSYARELRNPLDANWTATAAGDGQTDNAAAITFTTATASWGTINGMAICDSGTIDAGNMLFHTPLTAAKAVGDGDTAEFAIGAVTITFA